MGPVTIGVDIGQKVDPTAIAVVEFDRRPQTKQVAQPAGSGSSGVVLVEARTTTEAHLFLDATGVGTPVVDVLRDAGVAARLIPCYFTHGDKRTHAGGQVSIGKAWLVSRLQVLLQSERLHLPDTAEAHALAKELQDYEIRVSEDANDRYGAFKVGTHDDLVTALGLAVQPRRFTRLLP